GISSTGVFFEKLENKTDKDWTLLHQQVCGYIRQWMDDNILNHVVGEVHAHTVWTKFEQLYARKIGNGKLFLIKQLISLRYRDGTDMSDHLNIFQGVINQLSEMGIKFDEVVQGLWLLGTLPDLWETLRTSLSNSAQDGIISMELAKNSVLSEEMRRKTKDLLHIQRLWLLRREAEIGIVVKEIEIRTEASQKGEKNEDRTSDEHVTTTEDFLIVYEDEMISLVENKATWVVDNGASSQATPYRDFFISYTPGDFGSVKMGNGLTSKIVGIGDVCMETGVNMRLVLKGVKHIPDLRLNLISIGKPDNDGLCNTFNNGKWRLSRGDMVMARGHKKTNRVQFKSHPPSRKENILDLVYSDVCGPIKTQTVGGSRYFVTFIDDHSRKLWVYTLRTKDQVLYVFKEFHASVERETGRKLRYIPSDNGGEYSGPFDVYCKELVPENVWTGKEVSYDNLQVFGCKTFVHIPKDERSKFQNFIEDQAIEDIDKVKKSDAKCDEHDIPFQVDEQNDSHNEQDAPIHFDDQNNQNDGHEIPMHDYVQNDQPNVLIDQHDEQEAPIHVDEEPNVVQHDVVQPRRSNRERQPSMKYSPHDYVLLTGGGEPESYQKAMQHDDKEKWKIAMVKEMESLKENHTYELVELPKGRKALKNKWVYRLKMGELDSLPRYNARLVVKGFIQKEGVDFGEIFSPVVKTSSIRVVLGLATCMDLEVQQLDVKTTFLYGDLEEEIYMDQSEGFKVRGRENMVCKLKKSLYGLKHAPRQWYKKLESFMSKQGYTKTTSDHCVFVQKFLDKGFIILLLYIDDMLLVAKSVGTSLAENFKLSKKQCPSSVEEKLKIKQVPYASAVGSLIYAMVCTRPDLAHALSVVSTYLSNPSRAHWEAVKWIFRYLRGGAVSWQSRLQKCISLSTTEAKFIAFTEAAKEMM
nr:hypothetical protein [Tanacetum cinerariifolium]